MKRRKSRPICDARPGMRVLDLAAGAGGKSLALAAAMENRGEISPVIFGARRWPNWKGGRPARAQRIIKT